MPTEPMSEQARQEAITDDEIRVALDDTTTCLGNLLGTLIVRYPRFNKNKFVKADVDIAVRRLHLSKELLRRLELSR